MNVPFLDLKKQYDQIKGQVDVSLKVLLKRCDFILGEDVVEFERKFARYNGARFALGVNSGTDALFFSLLSLGISSGDEVIVPVFTYIASAFAVTYTGATPVFVDVDERTFNIDPCLIRQAITKRTKAVMPVHLYGQSADMDSILKISKKHGLKIVEDAAQAHGTEYKGKKAGSMGDLGAFSFYPTKNLGACGDAGMVVTNDEALYEKLKKLRDYGRKSRYVHTSLGYNSRLDSVQAVFLKEKLKRLDSWNKMRIDAAYYYKKLLSGFDGIVLPQEEGPGRHVYHIFAVRLKNRDKIQKGLKKAGIASMVHYPVPLHLQEVYKNLKYKKGDFPVAEKTCREVLCLPIYPHITREQIEYICKKLKGLVIHG